MNRTEKRNTRNARLARNQMVKSEVPVAMSYDITPDPIPAVHIKHMEYVGDVTIKPGVGTPTAQFGVERYQINPGDVKTFPWLSTIAHAFEKYEFLALEAIFVPTVSTTTQGAVSVAFDFDSGDDTPLNKRDMFTYEGVKRSPIWQTLKCPQRRDNFGNSEMEHFVRHGSVPPSQDVRLYDTAAMFVGITDTLQPVGAVVGEMWMKYTVRLFIAQKEEETITSLERLPFTYSNPFGGNITQIQVDGRLGGEPVNSDTFCFHNAGSEILVRMIQTVAFVTDPGIDPTGTWSAPQIIGAQVGNASITGSGLSEGAYPTDALRTVWDFFQNFTIQVAEPGNVTARAPMDVKMPGLASIAAAILPSLFARTRAQFYVSPFGPHDSLA